MRRVFFILFFSTFSLRAAFALDLVMCTNDASSCYLSHGRDLREAGANGLKKCMDAGQQCPEYHELTSTCVAVSISNTKIFFGDGRDANTAAHDAFNQCRYASVSYCSSAKYINCTPVVADTSTHSQNTESSKAVAPNRPSSPEHNFDFLSDPNFWRAMVIGEGLNSTSNDIGLGFGILAVLFLFLKRAAIVNFVVHGNLPRTLPVYGENIQCIFKRTQRINWYGRAVFGIVVNLSMKADQLADVRKYWLGRVIAFDSLRRQRQNQLAAMHMQLAAKAKSEAHDKKKFWSRRWATLRSFTKKLFWVVIALFNLVMAVFFIRVNIARIVRGTIIESKDLTLILQAKEAIEESTQYLKEYLITANTFDGRDEIYEPE